MAMSLGMLLIGCAHDEPRLTQPSQVATYGTERFSHTVYQGSDKEYHYFAWTHHLKRGSWKVPRYALELPGEFPRGKGEAFVKHDADANLIPFGFKPAREKKAAPEKKKPVSEKKPAPEKKPAH